MSFFAKLEHFCASLIERSFAKTFPSDLEPAQIARKLVATMEAATRDDDGRLHVPGAYAVFVNPADFERLTEHREYLERAWADVLRNLAAKVGAAFDQGRVSVVMEARSEVPAGAVEIRQADAPTQIARSFSLQTIEGVPPDARYPLKATTRIGRGDECDVVLLDPSVSRAHAVVEIAAGKARVRDLGSTNGTYLNGRRIEEGALRDGDELRLGNTRMRVEMR